MGVQFDGAVVIAMAVLVVPGVLALATFVSKRLRAERERREGEARAFHAQHGGWPADTRRFR